MNVLGSSLYVLTICKHDRSILIVYQRKVNVQSQVVANAHGPGVVKTFLSFLCSYLYIVFAFSGALKIIRTHK